MGAAPVVAWSGCIFSGWACGCSAVAAASAAGAVGCGGGGWLGSGSWSRAGPGRAGAWSSGWCGGLGAGLVAFGLWVAGRLGSRVVWCRDLVELEGGFGVPAAAAGRGRRRGARQPGKRAYVRASPTSSRVCGPRCWCLVPGCWPGGGGSRVVGAPWLDRAAGGPLGVRGRGPGAAGVLAGGGSAGDQRPGTGPVRGR